MEQEYLEYGLEEGDGPDEYSYYQPPWFRRPRWLTGWRMLSFLGLSLGVVLIGLSYHGNHTEPISSTTETTFDGYCEAASLASPDAPSHPNRPMVFYDEFGGKWFCPPGSLDPFAERRAEFQKARGY